MHTNAALDLGYFMIQHANVKAHMHTYYKHTRDLSLLMYVRIYVCIYVYMHACMHACQFMWPLTVFCWTFQSSMPVHLSHIMVHKSSPYETSNKMTNTFQKPQMPDMLWNLIPPQHKSIQILCAASWHRHRRFKKKHEDEATCYPRFTTARRRLIHGIWQSRKKKLNSSHTKHI